MGVWWGAEGGLFPGAGGVEVHNVAVREHQLRLLSWLVGGGDLGNRAGMRRTVSCSQCLGG